MRKPCFGDPQARPVRVQGVEGIEEQVTQRPPKTLLEPLLHRDCGAPTRGHLRQRRGGDGGPEMPEMVLERVRHVALLVGESRRTSGARSGAHAPADRSARGSWDRRRRSSARRRARSGRCPRGPRRAGAPSGRASGSRKSRPRPASWLPRTRHHRRHAPPPGLSCPLRGSRCPRRQNRMARGRDCSSSSL
jgi:hypothetical protein